MSTVITIPNEEKLKELNVIESKIIELLKGQKVKNIEWLLSSINSRTVSESTFLDEDVPELSIIKGYTK